MHIHIEKQIKTLRLFEPRSNSFELFFNFSYRFEYNLIGTGCSKTCNLTYYLSFYKVKFVFKFEL